jgi:hypothetical protein
MDITIDTSALIAVIVGELEKEKIIELTSGNTLKLKLWRFKYASLHIFGSPAKNGIE